MVMETMSSDVLFANLKNEIIRRIEAYYAQNHKKLSPHVYGRIHQELEENLLEEMNKLLRHQSQMSQILSLARSTKRRLLKKYGMMV